MSRANAIAWAKAANVAYDHLVRAATAGAPCPGNVRLAQIIGRKSQSSATKVLDNLVSRGMIRLERFQNHRIVTIVATGKRTAGEPGIPHKARCGNRWTVRHNAEIDDEALPARVDRDPCPRCGVRADIGCRHSPVRRLTTRISA